MLKGKMKMNKAFGWATVFFIVCSGLTMLLMPFDFRSSIIPKIDNMIGECESQLLDSQIKYDMLDKKILECKEINFNHTHRYSDGKAVYK